MKRLFLALPIPNTMVEMLENHMQPYKHDQHLLNAKWVSRENFHITILFLGEVADLHLAEMQSILKATARHIIPFTLYFERVEFFSYKTPKMIWARFQRSLAFLELHKTCKDFMKPYMDTEEEGKEPIPHLTLARLRTPIDPKKFSFKSPALPPLEATELELYESTLTPRGPIYTLLNRYSYGL